jgi:hypothetical protein
MSNNLVQTSTTIWSTTGQRYGSGCFVSGGQEAAGVLPVNKIFRTRVDAKTTNTGTQVCLGQTGAFWIGQNGGFAFAQYGTASNITTTVVISDGAWHNFDLRVDASGGALYVDGVLAGTNATANTAATIDIATNPLTVGALGGGFQWTGFVDECAISSVVPAAGSFTPAIIANSETGLLALWHLDSNGTDSAGVVAPAAPGAPTIGTATASSGAASVPFTPGTAGSTSTTGYTVTPYIGATAQSTTSGASSPIAVSGLTNGTAYTFKVHATNSVGDSAESAASNSVTPTGAATAPATMVAPTATAGNVSATVALTAPATGGSAITGYTVTSIPAGGTDTNAGTTGLSHTITGLTNGTPYTFTAKATNAVGTAAAASPASNSVTPSVGPMYVRVDTTDTVTGQNIMILVPSTGSANPYSAGNPTPVVLHSHGIGDDQTAVLTSEKLACTTAMLDAGYIVAGSNTHGANWGSQIAADDLAALDKYVRDNYNVKGVAIWGQSMGGHAGLLAVAHSKVKGVVGFLGTYPSCSLASTYAAGTYASSIDTSFGITGSGIATYANKTYGNDPALLPAVGFKHVPMRFYASPSDTTIAKANNSDVLSALIAGSSRENTVVVCTGAHGDASHFQPSDYVAFLARCFATPIALAGSLGAITPTTTKTIAVTFQNKAGTLQANLTGLKWEWSDVLGTVIDSGTGASTNGTGVFSVTSVHTSLAAAGVGYLKVTNSAGAVNTTDLSFNGAVAVS